VPLAQLAERIPDATGPSTGTCSGPSAPTQPTRSAGAPRRASSTGTTRATGPARPAGARSTSGRSWSTGAARAACPSRSTTSRRPTRTARAARARKPGWPTRSASRTRAASAAGTTDASSGATWRRDEPAVQTTRSKARRPPSLRLCGSSAAGTAARAGGEVSTHGAGHALHDALPRLLQAPAEHEHESENQDDGHTDDERVGGRGDTSGVRQPGPLPAVATPERNGHRR
jgi:hypothetical protein